MKCISAGILKVLIEFQIEADGNITEQAAVQIATTQFGVEDEKLLQAISRNCPGVSRSEYFCYP